MAYRVKRSERIVEDLELMDERGGVQEVIHVDLDPDTVAGNVSRKYIVLLEMQRKLPTLQEGLREGNEEADKIYEELGKSYLDLMETVFGAENTVRIAEFYEGRLMEMSKELSPFLFDVVIPKIRKSVQKNRRSKAQMFGLHRI